MPVTPHYITSQLPLNLVQSIQWGSSTLEGAVLKGSGQSKVPVGGISNNEELGGCETLFSILVGTPNRTVLCNDYWCGAPQKGIGQRVQTGGVGPFDYPSFYSTLRDRAYGPTQQGNEATCWLSQRVCTEGERIGPNDMLGPSLLNLIEERASGQCEVGINVDESLLTISNLVYTKPNEVLYITL